VVKVNNGTSKITEKSKVVDKTEVANKVWKAFFEDGREVSARSSDKEPDICGICGNDKSKAKRNKAGETVCEATERHCKESKKV
jgi:uncharacterized low-complexity protein